MSGGGGQGGDGRRWVLGVRGSLGECYTSHQVGSSEGLSLPRKGDRTGIQALGQSLTRGYPLVWGREAGCPAHLQSHPPPRESSLGSGTLVPSHSGLPRLLCPPPPHPRCAQSQGLEDLATSPHLSCAPPSGSQRPRPHPVSVAGSVSRAGAPPRPQVLSFPGTAHLRSHSSRRLGAEAWGFCSHESKQTVKASFPPSRAQQGWRGALVGQDTAGTGRLGVTG